MCVRDSRADLTLYVATGPQGKGWMKGTFSIKSSGFYQVRFEAIRGKGSRSEIAIDDIVYTAGGVCAPKGKYQTLKLVLPLKVLIKVNCLLIAERG